MLTLNDGRSELWQWDTKRKLRVDAECSQVHFSNKVFGRSIDVDVVDGVAIIPDILLQTDKDLTAWAFVGTSENGYTKISKVFKINRRNKPADYVFTPPEQTTLGEILERLDDLESVQDPDAIKNAVEDYLEQNPVEVPVQSVNGQMGEVKLTAEDVGAISQDDLQEATNEALAQAKASGEFDGADGRDGADGLPGQDGSDGITPHIGENGNWFIGETDTGKPSRGEAGMDGQDGQNGADGKDGNPGKDGVSVTHSWNGTTLTITSASGTSSADLKGEPGKDGKDGSAGADGVSPTAAVSKSGKVTTVSITDKDGTKTATINDGEDGAPGSAGKDGTSVTITKVTESTADGGSNVVTFSDGKTLTVKNGKTGATGAAGADGQPGVPGVDGSDGYTPVRGVDYYTDADKAEFSAYIATELAKRGQLAPEYANSIEDCTDTSKLYVLPDGYIYAYMYSEVEVGGCTNMVDPSSSDFQADKRYNASGAITSSSYDKGNCFVSNAFDIKAGDIVRIRGVARSENSNATAPIFGMAGLLSDGENYSAAHFSYLGQPVGATPAAYQQCWSAYQTLEDGTLEWVFAVNNAGENRAVAYSTIAKTRVAGVATNGIANVIVTVNEEIIEPSIVKDYQWTNTGHAFVPADYEDRILALEAEDVKIHTEIENLQEQIDSGAASAKSGARWFALGDSITEGWTSAEDESSDSGYKQYLNTNVAERWVNIVAEKNGYELTNYGVGGTGYAHAKTGTVNARAQVANIDFSQCDFVTLAYGVNDWKGKATLGSMDDDVDTVDAFVPNMRYVIKKILADNPYCKIFVITPINCRSLGSYATNYGINYANDTYASGPGLEKIFELEKAVCDYHGIELIDMTHSSIVNRENITTMLPDHVHPTVECHAVMARELAKKIAFA